MTAAHLMCQHMHEHTAWEKMGGIRSLCIVTEQAYWITETWRAHRQTRLCNDGCKQGLHEGLEGNKEGLYLRHRSYLNAQNISLVQVISQFKANRSKSERKLTKGISWWVSAIDLLIS